MKIACLGGRGKLDADDRQWRCPPSDRGAARHARPSIHDLPGSPRSAANRRRRDGRQRLVLGCERRSRHVRDHETRVHAWPSRTRNGGRPDKVAKSISNAIRRSASAPISAGRRARGYRRRKRRVPSWKLPPDKTSPVSGKNQRIIRHGVRFDQLARLGGMAHFWSRHAPMTCGWHRRL